jgi:hypothetical protein
VHVSSISSNLWSLFLSQVIVSARSVFVGTVAGNRSDHKLVLVKLVLLARRVARTLALL